MTSEDVLEGRDISLYDDGGHVDCRRSPPKPKDSGLCDRKTPRDFVYEHWNEKKRGYIRISYSGTDAWGTDHIFVEPNESGEWCVVWRIARGHAIEEYDDRIDEYQGIISVEKVYLKDGKSWYLALINAAGDRVTTLNPN